MSKEKYAELLNLIPHEAMQILKAMQALKDVAGAEKLEEVIISSNNKG